MSLFSCSCSSIRSKTVGAESNIPEIDRLPQEKERLTESASEGDSQEGVEEESVEHTRHEPPVLPELLVDLVVFHVVRYELDGVDGPLGV